MEKAINRILVPLDLSAYTDAATKTACRIAKAHGAALGGVVVLDSHEITSNIVPAIGPYYPPMIDAVDKKMKHADDILKDCMSRFVTTCEEEKVEHFETQWEGIPAEKLLESSIFCDLIVIGLETFFHFETRGNKGDSLGELIDHTITPMIAVPEKGLVRYDRALVAFDGSLSSARALHDFARFALPFDFEITVFAAGKPKNEADFLLREAETFLRSHGIYNIILEQETAPIESSVQASHLESFDIIVAGTHSKRPIKDLFLGSFTKSLIDRKSIPLFLSH